MESGSGISIDELETLVVEGFKEAYPGIEEGKIVHMARNFAQVLSGIISIGSSLGGDNGINQMDVANALVHSCVWESSLGERLFGNEAEIGAGSMPALTEEEERKYAAEISARVADWLVGINVTKKMGESAFNDFIKGALALGAEAWERDRANIKY